MTAGAASECAILIDKKVRFAIQPKTSTSRFLHFVKGVVGEGAFNKNYFYKDLCRYNLLTLVIFLQRHVAISFLFNGYLKTSCMVTKPVIIIKADVIRAARKLACGKYFYGAIAIYWLFKFSDDVPTV